MKNFRPAHMVYDWELTFYENGKLVGRFVVAAPDSLVAEQAAERMAAEGVAFKVARA